MSSLFLHVGYHKTGTTFLQKEIFPNIPLKCITHPEVKHDKKRSKMRKLFNYSPNIWSSRVGIDALSSIKGIERHDNLLLSSEILIGFVKRPYPYLLRDGVSASIARSCTSKYVPASGLMVRKSDPYSFRDHIRELKKAVSRFGFSEVKVIVGIRRQDEYLASSYATMSHGQWGASQKKFEKWVRKIISTSIGYYDAGGVRIEYDLYRDKITHLLGKENVLFMPLEELKNDEKSYIKKLLKFTNLDDKKRYKKKLRNKINERKINRRSVSKNSWKLRSLKMTPQWLFKELPLEWIDYKREEKIRLTKEIKKQILNKYSKSNKRIDKKIENIDLKSYGYWS